MPGSSSLGFIGSGSVNPEIQFQAMSVPQRKALAISTIPHAASPRECRQSVPRTKLTLWNLILFLFHSGLAATTLLLGNLDLRVVVYRTALDFQVYNNSEGETAWTLVPSYVESGHLYFTWLVASFFILSALFHFLNATLLRSYYLSQLELCYTPTRWMEYFFSAPVMIVIVSYTLGIRNRSVLLAIATLVAITMPFGYWVECGARPLTRTTWSAPLSQRLLPWFIGHVPQVVAWLLIVLQFYDGTLNPADRAPAFVHVILWLELLLFFSFGAASLLSQWSTPQRFYQGEILFQILSLASKGLLGGLLIANVIIYSRFDEIYDNL